MSDVEAAAVETEDIAPSEAVETVEEATADPTDSWTPDAARLFIKQAAARGE